MSLTYLLVFAIWFTRALAAETYLEAYLINSRNNHNYGYATYGYWGGVLFLAILFNFYRKFEVSRAMKNYEGQEAITPRRSPSIFKYWTRTYLTTPPAFGRHHARLLYWCTIPTRLEFAIIAGYWIMTIVLCVVGHETAVSEYTKAAQLWQAFANRFALIAINNLPILWVFAGRNNVFIWATGWNFQTFNIFHRHIARVVILLIIGHASSYTHITLSMGRYQQDLKEDYFLWGVIGATCLGAFWLTSISWLRRNFYEVFLLTHISLAIVVIYAIFQHIKVVGPYGGYLWAMVGVWSLDRFLRIVRLVTCNLNVTFGKSFVQTTSTTATYDEVSDVIRLQIEVPGLRLFKPTPGQYCFLYQPGRLRFYENHPFTVGAWTSRKYRNLSTSSEASSTPSSVEKIDSRLPSSTPSAVEKHESLSPVLQQDTSNTNSKTLVFYIRPYDGWTRRLRNQCMKMPSRICQPKLLVEGPYGHSEKLHHFDTIVLIAGGTGISAVLPYIKDHAIRSSSKTSRTTDMKLVWLSRKPSLVHTVYEQELSSFLPRPDVKLDIFITDNDNTVVAKQGLPNSSEENILTGISSTRGRPDFDELVGSTISELRSSDRCAFFVCGPPAMADDARAAVHDAMKRGIRNVEYFEDSYGW